MKTSNIIAAIVIFIGVIVALFILSRNEESVPQKTQIWETKIDDQGEVTVSITPPNFAGNDSVWKFKVVLDTHSVELIDDLAKNATLTVDGRDGYQPLGWEGDPLGGHHRQGDLLFEAVGGESENIVLELKNIGNVLSRRFQWSLKK